MKTLFATGFGNTRNPWFSMSPSGAFMGSPMLGRGLTAADIDAYTAKITNGKQRLAAVRKWIASRIDADPMLRNTFTKGDASQNFIVDNFWGYDDLVNKDQYYVDQTESMINNPTSGDYEIPDEDLDRTDEWAQVVDIMYAAMQEYGGTPATPVAPGTVPAIKPITTGPLPVVPGVKPSVKVAPSVAIPSSQPMILGIPQNTFLLGAGVLGAGALILALA